MTDKPPFTDPHRTSHRPVPCTVDGVVGVVAAVGGGVMVGVGVVGGRGRVEYCEKSSERVGERGVRGV